MPPALPPLRYALSATTIKLPRSVSSSMKLLSCGAVGEAVVHDCCRTVGVDALVPVRVWLCFFVNEA